MNYLFFDCETNGLPSDYKDITTYPRITQFAFQVYNEQGNITAQLCELIKPDGWTIPETEFFIKQGFTTEINNEKGVPISFVIEKFINAEKECNYRIAHNMMFDSMCVRNELQKMGLNNEFLSKKFCTMRESTNICKIPSKNGRGFKWPTLSELHISLFGNDFDGAHDALADIKATAKCFFELKRKGIIKI